MASDRQRSFWIGCRDGYSVTETPQRRLQVYRQARTGLKDFRVLCLEGEATALPDSVHGESWLCKPRNAGAKIRGRIQNLEAKKEN